MIQSDIDIHLNAFISIQFEEIEEKERKEIQYQIKKEKFKNDLDLYIKEVQNDIDEQIYDIKNIDIILETLNKEIDFIQKLLSINFTNNILKNGRTIFTQTFLKSLTDKYNYMNLEKNILILKKNKMICELESYKSDLNYFNTKKYKY